MDDAIRKVMTLSQSELIERQLALLRGPLLFDLEVSSRCNIRCSFCPRSDIEKKKTGFMSKQVMDVIINKIPEGSNAILSGLGEPLLNPRLPYLIKKLAEKGVGVSLITNGLLLDSDKVNELIKAGLDEIQVSFSALDPNIYSALMPGSDQNRVLRNLMTLPTFIFKDFRVRLNIVACVLNNNEIPKLEEFARNMSMIPFIRQIHSRGGFIKTNSLVQHIEACGSMAAVTFVSWDGLVLSCSNDVMRVNIIGNILVEDLNTILKRKEKIIKRNQLFSNCKKCDDDYRYLILFYGGVDNNVIP